MNGGEIMKKLVLYFLLFTYSTVMLKPVIPYVADLTAHLLFFKDHMLTVHAHNGKFHVHKEMAEAEKNDQTNNNTGNSKKEIPIYDHINIVTHKLSFNHVLSNWPVSFSNRILETYIYKKSPPPKNINTYLFQS